MYARKSPRGKNHSNQKNEISNKREDTNSSPSKSSSNSEVLAATKDFTQSEFSWQDVLVGASDNASVKLASDKKESLKRSYSPLSSKNQPSFQQRSRFSSQSPRQRTAQQIQSIRMKNEQVLQSVQNLSKDIQLMVLLCGIPGSGKSTIANKLVETSQLYYDASSEDMAVNTMANISGTEDFPSSSQVPSTTTETQTSTLVNSKKRLYFLREWVAYTQDQFKSRKVMERYCNDAILKGYNLIIDRCNFDAEQRSHWIRMIYDYYSNQQQYYSSYGRSVYPYGDISPPPSKSSYSSLNHHSQRPLPSNSHFTNYNQHNSYTSNPYAHEFYQTMVPSEAVVETSYPSTSHFPDPPEKPFYILCVMVPNFDNYEVCAQRATDRGDDGLHDADTVWRKVCASMVQNLKYPSIDEAIDGIYHCNDEKDLDELMEMLLFGLRETSSAAMPVAQR